MQGFRGHDLFACLSSVYLLLMTPEELFALAEKVASGIANDQEITTYYTLLQQQQVNVEWQDASMGDKQTTGAIIRERIWNKIESPVVRRMQWQYAAAAILLIAAGTWFWIFQGRNKSQLPLAQSKMVLSPDIHPGGSKATLQLEDGSMIVLDSASNGILAQQSGTVITKQTNGQLSYQLSAAGQPSTTNTAFNTLSTPRGGQYSITLPDGTRVWLNAASSIRYPAAFTGSDRQVTVTGEAYFEVAPLANKPFKVNSDNQQITVLGTSFNINAYPDENTTNTTLLTGSISITNQRSAISKSANSNPTSAISKSANLAPGQQATIHDGVLRVMEVNTSSVIAWKNGLFEFDNADVQSIMRQLSRWYEVEVKYKGPVTARRFTGKILRNAQLSEVLEMLSYAGISFTAKDKTIEVTN